MLNPQSPEAQYQQSNTSNMDVAAKKIYTTTTVIIIQPLSPCVLFNIFSVYAL